MAEAPAPAARLAALQRDYRAQLPQRLAAIEESWSGLATGSWEAGSARELLRLVHNLTGSGATFGVAELSAAAREFEQQLQAAIGDRSPLSAEARARIQAALAQVQGVVRRLTATAGP